jgi:hypothetical protein
LLPIQPIPISRIRWRILNPSTHLLLDYSICVFLYFF